MNNPPVCEICKAIVVASSQAFLFVTNENFSLVHPMCLIEKQASEIAHLKDERRWIPVEERLPIATPYVSDAVWASTINKYDQWAGDEMLYWVPNDWGVDGYTYYKGWYRPNVGVPINETVTHWMPLPKPPER